MAERAKLNKTGLAKLKGVEGKQVIVWDTDLPGFGVRVNYGRLVDGVRQPGYTFFCQGRFKGREIKVTIGKHPTFSPDQARKTAREYLGKMAAGQDPRIAKETKQGVATFGEMLMGYTEWMKDQKKMTAAKVEREIRKHIEQPHRTLWNRSANRINIDDCDRIIARLEKAGSMTQADKIRSYMKSAFRKAINARRNRKMPDGLKRADVQVNPCNDIEKVAGSSETSGRALSLAEFRAFWNHVKELPEPGRSIMMLFVLTGGQRERQLSRVTLYDIDRDEPSMTVKDYKGRRTEPYLHVIPLLPEALECIDRLTGGGQYVFTCNGGQSPINSKYIGERVEKIREAMEKAGELERGHFTPKTIRKTVETRLSGEPYSVSSEVLAHLESHGRGTIQSKNYNRYTYFKEKMKALEMLERMVEGKPEPSAQVLPFNREATA